MEGPLKVELDALRPGDHVTVVDVAGTRFMGTVQARRPGIDPDDELPIRRSNSTVHWIKHERIREIERGV